MKRRRIAIPSYQNHDGGVRTPLLVLTVSLAACAAPPGPSDAEGRLRAKLGVPPEAKTVVVFAQAAHLDIDWQRTFDDYYATWVRDIFLEARQLLDAQPRAFYSVAEMAYLERHLLEHPEETDALRAHAQRGALRIVGGGKTSPDTLLPETELILRDYLYGARFSEDVLGVRPHAAWLPDSFGHSATAPDLLAAAGFDSVGFARIDGAPTFFESIRTSGPPPPRPGSTAEELAQRGLADFVWRGAGGSSVLAHYVASGLYCTGDNIDYDESLQLPGGHLGVYYGDDPTFTDGKIASYVAALAPYAKTPYVFVPVGCDFQHPKNELVSYLDGYDRRQYPSTGIWAVAAPFEDYMALVAAHKDALPELAADLEPYFMGFYGTRAGVKRRVRDAARPFFAAETFAVALGAADPDARAAMAQAGPALERLTLADHHDFVTGTSNDMVAASEQLPLLDVTEAAGQAAFDAVAEALAKRLPAQTADARVIAFNPSSATAPTIVELALPPGWPRGLHAIDADVQVETVGRARPILRIAADSLPSLGWRAIDLRAGAAPLPPARVTAQLLDAGGQPASGAAVTQVVLTNEHVRASFTRAQGFALTSLVIDGAEAIADRSFVVGDYSDQGGLWRTGNEMPGCALTALPPSASELDAEVAEVVDRSRLSVTVRFTTATATREARLDAGARGLALALTTSAQPATTRTATFRLAVPAGAPLRTSLAGGFADRVPERVYTPTYWPAVEWLTSGGWAILLRQSTGARLSASGEVELMAVRDARSEQCDIEGGMGSDPDTHRIEWYLTAAATPAEAARAAQAFNRPPILTAAPTGAPLGTPLPAQASLASLDGDGLITALKPADRGDGIILRALVLPGPAMIHLSPALAPLARVRTDAAERDLEPLAATADTLSLDRATDGPIATFRLH
jgi:hypothetical protein